MSLINQALELMLYGMGIVFIFLILLALLIALMSKLAGALSANQEASSTAAPPVDAPTLKVLQAAIDAHRGQA